MDGQEAGADFKNLIKKNVFELRSRLPSDQAEHLAAVVLLAADAPAAAANAMISELRAAGVQRIAVKREP